MAMSQQEKTDYKRKFNKDSYDRIGLYLPKGQKQRYIDIAKSQNVSLSAYIVKALEEKITRDNLSEPD